MNPVIDQALAAALKALKQRQIIPADWQDNSVLTRTKSKDHGDFASNLALVASKPAGLKPRDLAELIVGAIPELDQIKKVEIAGPGFINFYLESAERLSVIAQIIDQGDQFGVKEIGDRKILVEFVSANPTGPLHVGHGRQAALGDVLCRLHSAQGFNVHREFYYNDAGAQISKLGLSVKARIDGLTPESADWPSDGYQGDYIAEIGEAYLAGSTVESADRSVTASGDASDLSAITEFAVAYLRREQDLDLKAFDLDFDHYFLESSLYTSSAVDQAVEQMSASGHTYELDGALWLKTTDFGDDKDRVMRKSAGGYTYFVPDVAYHLNKYARGYTHAINIQGTDHHGTIARVRAGLQAVNPQIPKNYPEYVLHTMVRVVTDGQEVKISKRSGSYITLRDLIDWTSSDAVRFLLLSRKADTEFTFDVDLAVSKSNDNPVYYVQYAHARACQLAAKAAEARKFTLTEALSEIGHLTEDSETELAAKLANYPDLIARAQSELGPHLLVTYLRELAALFHSWYNGCRVIPETLDDQSEPLMLGRLALSEATRQVIANGLGLLGVSAPNQM